MKLKVSIEYSATADREGETSEDEERVLGAARELFDEALAGIRRRCEEEGIEMSVER